jgi:DNA-binding GntR family transcriptional regulator
MFESDADRQSEHESEPAHAAVAGPAEVPAPPDSPFRGIQLGLVRDDVPPLERLPAQAKPRDGLHVSGIRDRLRDAILRGEISAGAVTTQVELAKTLGVSRTPLREALRMLQSEGLVVSQPNRRVQVASMSIDELEEIQIVRIQLEVAAIRLTIPRLTGDDLAQLEGLLAQMDHFNRRRDYDGVERVHRDFHGRLISAAGPRLTELLGQYFDHAGRYRRVYVASDTPWTVNHGDHRALLDAAEAGDADRAAGVLARHYSRMVNALGSRLGPDYAPTRMNAVLEFLGRSLTLPSD